MVAARLDCLSRYTGRKQAGQAEQETGLGNLQAPHERICQGIFLVPQINFRKHTKHTNTRNAYGGIFNASF
jgi:hypothetical protein